MFNFKATGAVLGSITALSAAFAGSECLNSARFPAECGVDFLKDIGYLDIRGGNRDYFNLCGGYARHYKVVGLEGVEEDVTVCFNPYSVRFTPLE